MRRCQSELALEILTSSPRLQSAFVKHGQKKNEEEEKKLTESLLRYRSVKSDQNKRVEEVALVLIVTVSSALTNRFGSNFFFLPPSDRIVPRCRSGVRTPSLLCDSPPAFLSVYPANLLSPSVDSHMISLPTAPLAVLAGARSRERV